MSYLTQNLAALASRFSGKLPAITESSDFMVRPAASGAQTMVYRGENGDILLHSKYDPLREASRLVDAARVSSANIIIVLGLGLGYHVEQLMPRLQQHQQVLIIDPSPEAVAVALGARDLTAVLAADNLRLTVAATGEEGAAAFAAVYDPQRDTEVSFLALPALERLHRDFFAAFRQAVQDVVRAKAINEYTLTKLGPDVIKASLFNLKDYVTSPGAAALFGLFPRVPAIIVAAGPSLNKNVHLLRRAKGKAVIIAVGTAVAAVQAAGVEPDVVISIDPGEPNYKIFHALSLPDSVLVADLQSHYRILEEHQGIKFMFTNPGNLIYHWIHDLFADCHSFLESGGSVANNACALAYKMGCDPIVFVGQDLCLSEDGHTHAAGTVYEGQTADDSDTILVPANGGGQVRTKHNWYQFLRWFEQWIKYYADRTYINATEGGACIKGTDVQPLAAVLNAYCNHEVGVTERIRHAAVGWHQPSAALAAVDRVLADKGREVRQIRRDVTKARDIIAGLQRHAAAYNAMGRSKKIKQLRRINQALDENVLFALVQEMDYGTVRCTMYKTYRGSQSADDTFAAAAQDSVEYYEAMASAASRLLGLLVQARERLRGETKKWA